MNDDDDSLTSAQLLENNKRWAADQIKRDPNFFKDLALIQRPKILWIGCADSRVPPTEVTCTRPGDIFVHRNVGNVVIHTDMNLMTVLQYAVEVLNIHDIIVCGHTNCGGIRHALSNKFSGLINKWLTHVKDAYVEHAAELDKIHDPDMREKRMIEINVESSVKKLAMTDTVQRAWAKDAAKIENKPKDELIPRIHGWVYDLATGIVTDLKVNIEIHPIFILDVRDVTKNDGLNAGSPTASSRTNSFINNQLTASSSNSNFIISSPPLRVKPETKNKRKCVVS